MTAVTQPSEAFDVDRLKLQDAAAFEMLVRNASGRMLAVASRMLRSNQDAQDAVQEAFIQAYKALPQFEARCSITTWLHSITVRACLMKLRHQRTRKETDIDPLLPQFKADGHRMNAGSRWSDCEASAIDGEDRTFIRKCIDQLPNDYRNIILLRDIEEMDTREVAEHLEISESLVKTRLHRARQALRSLLEPRFQGA
jgi:RNA polymerase sigma-70 factor (ECF subfamily)